VNRCEGEALVVDGGTHERGERHTLRGETEKKAPSFKRKEDVPVKGLIQVVVPLTTKEIPRSKQKVGRGNEAKGLLGALKKTTEVL